jgi:hypothetical protein
MAKLSDLRSCERRDVACDVSTEQVSNRRKMKKKLSLGSCWITLFYIYAKIGERLLGFLGIKFSVPGQP